MAPHELGDIGDASDHRVAAPLAPGSHAEMPDDARRTVAVRDPGATEIAPARDVRSVSGVELIQVAETHASMRVSPAAVAGTFLRADARAAHPVLDGHPTQPV